jgi:hypothetical protein
VYRVAGWGGLIVVFAAMTAAALMLAFARSPGRPYFAALALVLGAYASAPSWGVRPHTISLLLASLFLLVLERSEENKGLLWWTVPLTLLWVNLHAEYALGIALLGIFLAGECVEAVLGCREWSNVRLRLRTLAVTTVACLMVVPFNPNGTKMYFYPIDTLRSAAMQKYIAEWASPNFHDAKYLPFAGMLMALLFLLSTSSKKVRPRDLFLLLIMTAGALRSVRHISIFVLVAVPILSDLARGLWREQRWQSATRRARSGQKLALNAMVLATFLVFTAVRLDRVVADQRLTEADHFPSGAVAFMASHHPPGPILNHYNFGGYFIWRLPAEYPVFIDGRADLYGDSFLADFARTYYVTGAEWRQPIERWGIRTVILPPDAPLITALRLNGGWKEIYNDSQATIVTRGQ